MNGYVTGAVILGLIVIGYYVLRNKKNVKTFGPVIMYRTKRGVNFINRTADLSPRFWKAFSTIGVILGFIFMIYITYALLLNAINIITKPGAIAGAGLVIPGITIPFWWGIIGLITVLISHEFMHGIIARAEGIKVKSVGSASLGFLPIGAFTEPDEKQVKKAKTITQLRIFAGGSFANIILAFLTLLIVNFALMPAFTAYTPGAYLLGVDDASPAENAGLEEGMLIQKVGGIEITNTQVFVDKISELKPGDSIELETDQGSITSRIGIKEGKNYIGINFATCQKNMYNEICYKTNKGVNPKIFWFTVGLLAWVIILNLGIGLFNLLPLKPFDGGLMIESTSKRFAPKLTKNIVVGLSVFSLILVLINIAGPYFWSIFL